MTTGIMSVRAATIKNEPDLYGEITVDDVPLFEGDICLVRVQDTETQNGTYMVMEDADWVRIGPVFHNQLVNVREGQVNAETTYQLVPALPDPIIVGTTLLKYLDISHLCAARLASTFTGIDHPLTGLANVDNKTPVEGDIVLIKDQLTLYKNGTYVANGTLPWKRIGRLRSGQQVSVKEGDRNGGRSFILKTPSPIIEETTAIEYWSYTPESPIYYADLATFSAGLLTPIVLSGMVTVDSVLTQVGDIVLVRDQIIAGTNGPYIAKTGAWIKLTMPSKRSLVFVGKGTIHATSAFMTINDFSGGAEGLGSYFRLGS
jgi:hypothetical protein